MTASETGIKWNLRIFYLLTFLAFGSLYPLLAVYLDETVGLTGSQIGMIMSISPVVMIIIQPLWGIASDYFQKPKLLLTLAIFLSAIFGFIYSFPNSFPLLVIMAIMIAAAQSAVAPLSDSITLSYVQKIKGNYGSFRLWGAIGYAVSVLIVGWISDISGLSIIFYCYTFFLLISLIFSWRLPEESQSIQVNITKGIQSLSKRPNFLLFLVSTFLVFGPILANNTYFGIFIKDIGGTLTGVGIAFLLAAGSEAPFMQFAKNFINKIGILHVLLLASTISMVRWIFYFFEPSLLLVYATTIAQGFSVGLFVPAALQYIKEASPKEVQVTAVSLYSAVGNGLGSWFCTYFGGLILEWYSIQQVYLFYGILTGFGILIIVVLYKLDFSEKVIHNKKAL